MEPNLRLYPNKHITKNGQLFSLGENNKWKELSVRVHPITGYRQFIFRNKGELVGRYAHHLVLEAHCRPKKRGEFAVFKNRDKTDIRIENLQWLSKKEYEKRQIKNIKNWWKQVISAKILRPVPLNIGEKHHHAKLTNAQAVNIFNSQKNKSLLSRKFNVSRDTITRIKKRKSWKRATRNCQNS